MNGDWTTAELRWRMIMYFGIAAALAVCVWSGVMTPFGVAVVVVYVLMGLWCVRKYRRLRREE